MDEGKIRVMHFVHSLNEGGIERLLLELCKKIDKNRFEIQICCLVEKGLIADEFERIGIKLHFVNAKRDFKIKNFIPNFFVLFKIVKLLKREKITITHGHEFYSTVFSRIASKLSGVKKRYITLHNVYHWWGKGIHKTQKFLSNFTSKIICNSKATLNYSLEHDKINREKYILIYNGIDCVRFSPKKSDKTKFLKEFNLSENQIICMSVGSISPRKGFEYLIKAADILHHSHPDLVFIIVGGKHYGEENEFEELRGLISKLNLNQRVIITGSRNDVSSILNFCDLFVMPSVVEGFGLALAEAMSMERVCIASDIEPFKEIMIDNKEGIFFKSEGERDLAAKIEQVLSMNKSELCEIKLNARKKVVSNFNSDTMVRDYEKLYSE